MCVDWLREILYLELEGVADEYNDIIKLDGSSIPFATFDVYAHPCVGQVLQDCIKTS